MPSEVSTLLLLGFVTEEPPPEVPLEPEVPGLPSWPDEPELPEVPLAPSWPEEPELPEVPLAPS